MLSRFLALTSIIISVFSRAPWHTVSAIYKLQAAARHLTGRPVSQLHVGELSTAGLGPQVLCEHGWLKGSTEDHEDTGEVLPVYPHQNKNCVKKHCVSLHRIDVAIQGKLAGKQLYVVSLVFSVVCAKLCM